MLYHFSEDSTISTFIPRPAKQSHIPPAVWAINEENAVHYYLPRDCPRVIYAKSDMMSTEDEARFFGHTVANKIIVVENDWLEQISNTTIYKYTFKDSTFQLLDANAGYYISQQTVKPIQIEPMTNLIQHIVRTGVELRFTPNLHPIYNAVLASTVDAFSIIRFQHAKPLAAE
ncbi:DUF6886 family protein [Paenibacillaceae sp. P-4]|uniref:DUF6886 family protein n=1 Tax=Paenibacillaceae bacterium P-4 TaxID=3160969 RepID=UPI0032E82E9B